MDKRAEIFMLRNKIRLMRPGYAREELLQRIKRLEAELREA